jgi:hypothetical protein
VLVRSNIARSLDVKADDVEGDGERLLLVPDIASALLVIADIKVDDAGADADNEE